MQEIESPQNTNDQKRLLLTGITGYLGSWIAKYALESGLYQLRATVRDKTKLDILRQAFGEENFNKIEFLEAKFEDPESLELACEGQELVIHTASNIPHCVAGVNVKDKDYQLAAQAMKALLVGAQKNGATRFIFTSSIVPYGRLTHSEVVDESSVADLTRCSPFEKAKLMAENEAKMLLDSFHESKRVEMVTMRLGTPFGPSLIGTNFSQGGFVKGLLKGENGAPPLMLPAVDVQDIAKAHLKALQAPKVSGEAIQIVAESIWFHDIGKILNGHLGKKKEIKMCTMPYFIGWIGSKFSGQIAGLLPHWNKKLEFSREKSESLLDMKYASVEDSIIGMAKQFDSATV